VQNVLASISILWIVAMGMTFVLVSGGFDLSVGAIAALCGIFLGKVLEAHLLPGPVAVAATIIVGAVLGGLLNGLFVAVFRLSVFVVTLASMTALTGIVLIWTNTQSIYVTNPVVNQISISRLLGVQTPIYIMIIVFAIFLYVQRRTYFGRDIYATGGSYTAARLSGVRTERTLIMVYAVAGACAGLAGAIAVGRVGAAVPQVDPGLALQAVAAVLIGGTALTGGAGSVVGTAFGCLFIGILQNGLNMVGVASSWQYVVTGIILLASVLGGRVGGKRGGMLTWLKKALGFRAPPPAASCEVEPAGDAASRGGESG
jgi:ribose/xylose/arabinose/galactoside ABC-type transport system permease subunit